MNKKKNILILYENETVSDQFRILKECLIFLEWNNQQEI